MTTFFMLILLLFLAVEILWGYIPVKPAESLLQKDYTTALKGIFCVIVILVHTPAQYQNGIQDALGSFAYVGVTFFFFCSAYGLKYNTANKKGYLEHFWRNRLAALLIPALVINIVRLLLNITLAGKNAGNIFIAIFNINSWVKGLLIYYIVFYIVYKTLSDHEVFAKYRDWVVCLFIMALSLTAYIFPDKLTFIWPTESVGFVYGILAARHITAMENAAKRLTFWPKATVTLCTLILGVAYLKFKNVPFAGEYLLKIVLGLFILIFILSLTGNKRFGNKISIFMGNISYEIYLLHGAVFSLVGVMDSETRLKSGEFIIICIASTVFLSYIIHLLNRSLINKIRV